MNWRRKALILVCLLLVWGRPATAAEPDQTKLDEQTLKDAGLRTDGSSLMEFFKNRTLSTAQREKIQTLIDRLGDSSYEQREKASQALVALGTLPVPLLNQAVNNPDLEIARRAEDCLRLINRGSTLSVVAAAARVLADRKPSGAAEVLLAYLPCVEEEGAADEVRLALGGVAVHDGKPEEVVVAALTDKSPAKRAAAADALARAGGDDGQASARKLLTDEDVQVRL